MVHHPNLATSMTLYYDLYFIYYLPNIDRTDVIVDYVAFNNMFYFKLFVCLFYGLVSIAQTLVNRYLFRTLQFKFYSTVHTHIYRSSSSKDSSSSSSVLQATTPVCSINKH